MVMYRGLADDLALMDWLQKYIFPAEAKTVSPEIVRIGTRLAALEMIESGTTTYADMYYFEEEIARATREAGLRGVLGQTIIQFPVADAKTPAEGLRARRGVHQGVPGRQPDRAGRGAARDVHPRRGDAHGVRGARPALRACRCIIHLAETEDEVKIAREQHQMTPTAYLESHRLLGARTRWPRTASGSTDDDIAILKRRAGRRLAQPREQHEAGERHRAGRRSTWRPAFALGLGTDGAASNNDLDMFEAMRQAAFLAKHATRDPTAVPAQAALDLATIGGARALGMERPIGSLEAGQARRPDHRVDWPRAADAAVRPGLAPRLRHPRRRRADDDRQRQGADEGPAGADARSRRR